jgi:hypothetical protein
MSHGNAIMKASYTRNKIASTASAKKVAVSTTFAEVITPPRTRVIRKIE